jgi:hypothetical protein
MKKVILFLLFIPVPLFCQVTDNFETGTLIKWKESVAGHWKADTSGALSGKYSLHHVYDNSLAGNDQIGIPIINLEPSMGLTKWSFKLRHGYDPSSSNNWGVFLISDNQPSQMFPGGNVNGYAIGVNLTGYDDTLRLWKVKNGVLSVVLNSGINWQNNIKISSYATINVERSASGRWNIIVISSTGAILGNVSGTETELFDAEWFGVYYRYTSTCDRLIWVDDVSIEGVFYEDKEPPKPNKCILYTYSSLDLTLDEEPSAEFFSASNFSLNDTTEKAISVLKTGMNSSRITFKKNFINKSENNLIISSMCDKSGNCSRNTNVQFIPAFAEPGDVVISEIMADPLPPLSLPAKEYIEIFNRTRFQFNLKNWKLATDDSHSVFPEKAIDPFTRMILCQMQDTLLFSKYGSVTGLKSFPALLDGGMLLVLSDSFGNLIHGVEYSPLWYGDKLKEEGGWSLEMIDTGYPFFYEGNWIASKSGAGGTPGFVNSVSRSNPDIAFKGITNAFPGDSSYLRVSFSEPVKNLADNLYGIKINGGPIQTVSASDPLQREFLIKPFSAFLRGQHYLLEIPADITDFAGNRTNVFKFDFGLPENVSKGDLVFNEILFNPFAGDADYIELYNSSSKNIDVSELSLVSVSESGVYSASVPVSDYNRIITPGKYYAITTDMQSVLRRYISAVPENVFETSRLPSTPDDKGDLVLLNRQLELIDEVRYNEKMHFPLLSGYEGIALEKIRPSLFSTDPGNWHSASEASGWGTPGAPNSIYSELPATDDRIVFSSKRITPDNDGNDDLLVIDFNLKGTGNVINVTVFDETGGLIRKLASNFFAATKATISWDCTADDGSMVRSGIYVLLISVFDETGKSEKWKKVCTVIR